MQIKISQVKRRFHMEYGTDVDEFLDTIYQAGMDVERDLASEKERVEAISRSNQYLRLIDEAVDLMRRYHPQGERYYWVACETFVFRTASKKTVFLCRKALKKAWNWVTMRITCKNVGVKRKKQGSE